MAASLLLCPNLWPLWVGKSSAATLCLVSEQQHVAGLHLSVCQAGESDIVNLISAVFCKIYYSLIKYRLPSVTGTTTKITTIPMASKPNVIVVQKTTGKGATIQGLPGKNVVTTLLNAGVSQTAQCYLFIFQALVEMICRPSVVHPKQPEHKALSYYVFIFV